MYIKKIKLENVRCFKNIEIDLNSTNEIRKWTLVLGDNGVGKTTFLRSIAMGLCDATSAAALLRELYGEWICESGKNKGAYIYIEFESEHYQNIPYIKTSIETTPSGYSKVEQETKPDPFPWDDIFVCGYGAARRAFGTKDYNEYAAIDAVYTLFNYDSPLQNPELILRRIDDSKTRKLEDILEWINEILMLSKKSIELDESGIQIKTNFGDLTPAGAVGDGYQATLAWITDFLGWALLYDKKMFQKGKKLEGIVLLDEVEQHLHPSWQRNIIKLLKQQFPHIQFITTTHAPMCVIGTTELTNEECKIVLLYQGEDYVQAWDEGLPPRGQRADQVLTSYLFGLPTSGDNETKWQIERYSKLLMKKRNSEEDKELKNLRIELDKKLGTKETELERIVAAAIRETLQKTTKASRFDKKIVDYEIKRQLQELLDVN